MEALEQAVRLNEHNTSMGVRLQALKEQLEHARHEELRNALDAEEKTLRESIRVVQQQIGAMKTYFDSTTIEVNGSKMPAMQAFTNLQVMIGQRNSLERMRKGLNLVTCGNAKLEFAAELMKANIEKTLYTWVQETLCLATLLMGIQVPADRRDVFQCVWIYKNVKIDLVWNAKEQCFEPPPNGVQYEPDLEQFVQSATSNFSANQVPHGTTFTVTASEDEKGRKFSGRIKTPPTAPGAPPFPYVGWRDPTT